MAFVVSSTIASAPRRCPSGGLLQAMSVDASSHSHPTQSLWLSISLRSVRSVPARRRLIRSVRRHHTLSPQPLKSASGLTAPRLTYGQPSAVCLILFGSVVNFQEMGTPDSANAIEDRDWFSKCQA